MTEKLTLPESPLKLFPWIARACNVNAHYEFSKVNVTILIPIKSPLKSKRVKKLDLVTTY